MVSGEEIFIVTSQIDRIVHNLKNSIKEFKSCYVVVETTQHSAVEEQTRNDDVIMKLPTGDDWRVYERVQLWVTDDYNDNVFTLLTEKNISIAPPPYNPHL